VKADRKNCAKGAVRHPALLSRINSKDDGDAASNIFLSLFSKILTFDISISKTVRQLCKPVMPTDDKFSYFEGIIIETRHQNTISSF
jgi:hypothetical protein